MKLRQGVFLDLATVDNGELSLAALDRCLPAWRMHRATAADELAERLEEADVVVTVNWSSGLTGLGFASGATDATVADRLDVRFQVQLHKLLWNDEPGR